MTACALCARPASRAVLAEAAWLPSEVGARLAAEHSGWVRRDGACPACVQQALLETLLERGESALHASVQQAWPLDAEAAFGALPTPLRLHAHPRLTGAGVTLAIVDAGFYPHPDLVQPQNRIRAWADAGRDPVESRRFGPGATPGWPGWDGRTAGQWHGLMTTAVAAGNGRLSHGLYRGLAADADVVLVQVADAAGRISNASIARALRWLRREAPLLRIQVVNLSLGGDPVAPLAGNPVDEAVAALVEDGITVVVAAGNDGRRSLAPPATAPLALTVGGIDDRNTLDHEARELWRSNYGESAWDTLKPELVAPSLWVVAPVLPATPLAREADALFARRAGDAPAVERRISELKLVTPHYQHVEGTSFAAPVVAGTVACMLEANPALEPRRIRELLLGSAHPVPGAPLERQGAGVVDAGRAATLALADRDGAGSQARSPLIGDDRVEFAIHDHRAQAVSVVGSWDRWARPGTPAMRTGPGLWRASLARPARGLHQYKFLLDGESWVFDPANPERLHDGYGGWNSLLVS